MHKLHWTPRQFIDLDQKEKAVVIAFIDQRIEDEKKENKKLKSKSGSGRSRGRRRH